MSNKELPRRVRILNLWAVAGLVVAGVVGFGGLFLLPVLEGQGLSTTTAFWIMCVAEGGAAVLAALSVLSLHADPV